MTVGSCYLADYQTDFREGFDVEIELRDQRALGILAGIDLGEVDVRPEIWLPNLEQAAERRQNRLSAAADKSSRSPGSRISPGQ
jgi:hypothetical protein